VKRDFTKFLDISGKECRQLLKRARDLKRLRKNGKDHKTLAGKSLAMIFEKASTRTRISFEVGMHEMGGQGVFLSPGDTQIGRGEPIKDTARVLERYNDAIMIRTYSQDIVEELAKWASIPVINGLSDLYHPCQILADLLTIQEFKGDFEGRKIAYIGDGNNVATSWLAAAVLLDLTFSLATPEKYQPDKGLFVKAKKTKSFFYSTDPFEAVKDADVIYTDVWVSMGQEKEQKERKKAFARYKIDDKLLKNAKKDVAVMHCLPAYRGQEITDEVFEKYNEIIFSQAENRLHAQKALLEWLILNTKCKMKNTK
jgi:ornithine carbamoyltransferase